MALKINRFCVMKIEKKMSFQTLNFNILPNYLLHIIQSIIYIYLNPVTNQHSQFLFLCFKCPDSLKLVISQVIKWKCY